MASMNILPASSPNFAANEIPVEFLVLHYTSCSLERTLRIFSERERKVCAHFVLCPEGNLYDFGDFWNGPILQGAHAGLSHWKANGQEWERFNLFSIGIEIVNLNGNLYPYSEAQYASLAQISAHLQNRFPALKDPERVVGHEQIAGFRGKVDPGLCFDWERFYRESYPGQAAPERVAVLLPAEAERLRLRVEKADPSMLQDEEFWSSLSSDTESSVGQRKEKQTPHEGGK